MSPGFRELLRLIVKAPCCSEVLFSHGDITVHFQASFVILLESSSGWTLIILLLW